MNKNHLQIKKLFEILFFLSRCRAGLSRYCRARRTSTILKYGEFQNEWMIQKTKEEKRKSALGSVQIHTAQSTSSIHANISFKWLCCLRCCLSFVHIRSHAFVLARWLERLLCLSVDVVVVASVVVVVVSLSLSLCVLLTSFFDVLAHLD